jgi:hypothetical protein
MSARGGGRRGGAVFLAPRCLLVSHAGEPIA